MSIFPKGKTIHSSRPVRPVRKGKAPAGSNLFLRAVLLSFFCGVLLCVLLLCLFAILLTKTSLPLTLVRPMSCAAAAAGVAVAGLIFAKQVGQRLLLCGLGCGAFFAICQFLAAWMLQGTSCLQNGSCMLTVALLMSGIFGGALAAVWTVR